MVFFVERNLKCLPEFVMYALAEFRIGSSKLAVNSRNYYDIPRNERLCTNCDQHKLGDEYHFLFECSLLNDLRVRYLPMYFRKRCNIIKMKELIRTEKDDVIFGLAKFVSLGLNIYRTPPNEG